MNADTIIDAALSIGRAEGLSAMTMKRIAEEMGCCAMSLYTYFPSKRDLVLAAAAHATGQAELIRRLNESVDGDRPGRDLVDLICGLLVLRSGNDTPPVDLDELLDVLAVPAGARS